MRAMDPGLSSSAPSRPLFHSRKHARRSLGPQVSAFLILALVVGGAAGAWYWLSRDQPGSPAQAEAASQPLPATGTDAVAAPVPLPVLGTSDTVVREWLTALSAHSQWAAWLVSDDLVRRFVKTVVALGRGSSPGSHLAAAAPIGPFSVERAGPGLRIAPASFARYDLLTETFVSLDPAGSAQLYQRLHPLFEEAYAELGISDRSFDEMMALAIQNLLAVRVPERALEVTRVEVEYAFRDASVERLTPAAKQLLRLGPANAVRVQAKVAELSQAIGISQP